MRMGIVIIRKKKKKWGWRGRGRGGADRREAVKFVLVVVISGKI